MSRSTAASSTVVVLDVGKGMDAWLEKALRAVSLLVETKILHHPRDVIGVVLFGTRDTHNALMEHGYERVYTLRGVSSPDVELLKLLDGVSPGEREGDFVDALLVGTDLLLRHRGDDGKTQMKMFLISGGYSYANTNDLDSLASQFQEHGVGFNLIGVNFFEPDPEEDGAAAEDNRPVSAVKKRNEKAMLRFVTKTNGIYHGMDEGLRLLSEIRIKSVRQTPVYKGNLTVGNVDIPVQAFIKAKATAMPSMKKLSAESQQQAQQRMLEEDQGGERVDPPTMEVKMERQYKNIIEPDKTWPKRDQLIKGYRYGKTVVKMDSDHQEAAKYKADRCMVVLGFVLKSKVPRHFFMGQPELVVADSGNNRAGQCVASLVEAMLPPSRMKQEGGDDADGGHDDGGLPRARGRGGGLDAEERVALVRLCKKAKGGPPVLACLVPMIKQGRYHGFYCHKLPFAEDLRKYDFPGLSRGHVRSELCPSQEQLAAMEHLVTALDLEHGGPSGEELLKPTEVYNAATLQLYQVLRYRAAKVPETTGGIIDPSSVQLFPTDATGRPVLTLEEAQQLPALDAKIKETMEPNSALWGRPNVHQAVGEMQSNLFRCEWVVPKDKGKKRLWDNLMAQQAFANAPNLASYRDFKEDGNNEDGEKGKAGSDGDKNKRGKKDGGVTMNQLLHGDFLDTVGTTTPVADFQRIMARRDCDMVDAAITQLKAVIQKLVDDSIQGHLYDKALDCAVALRKGCVLEDEPDAWNEFARWARSEYRLGMHREFWNRIVREKLSLINFDESGASTVTPAEALVFLLEDESEAVDEVPGEMEEDDGDLFDMIE